MRRKTGRSRTNKTPAVQVGIFIEGQLAEALVVPVPDKFPPELVPHLADFMARGVNGAIEALKAKPRDWLRKARGRPIDPEVQQLGQKAAQLRKKKKAGDRSPCNCVRGKSNLDTVAERLAPTAYGKLPSATYDCHQRRGEKIWPFFLARLNCSPFSSLWGVHPNKRTTMSRTERKLRMVTPAERENELGSAEASKRLGIRTDYLLMLARCGKIKLALI